MTNVGITPDLASQADLAALANRTAALETLVAALASATPAPPPPAPVPIPVPVPLPSPPPPSAAGLLFFSDWSTAIGNSDAAIRDGGRWNQWTDWSGGNLLTVVAGGPPGHDNALRVQQRGPQYAARVQKDGFGQASQDYYVGFWMRNDDTSPTEDHIISTIAPPDQADLIYVAASRNSGSWTYRLRAWSAGFIYPISGWNLSKPLSNGTWYHLAYFVHFVAPTFIQVHPRITDANGLVVATDTDFRPDDGSTWNGSAWNLASFYAAGNSIGLADPTRLTHFSMGNNGQANAVDTGKFWYYGGVEIRSDTWPAP